jgi:hypothetical protein
VTLSKPHCAITSAENPEGIASQAFTTALPEAQTFFTLFATFVSFPLTIYTVTASQQVGPRRRPMTCFAKQSMIARKNRIASSCAPRNDDIA